MGLRAWSARLDRRAQDTARRPYVAPSYLGGAAALGLYGLLLADERVMPLTFAAVWAVFGGVSMVARSRDRRRGLDVGDRVARGVQEAG